MVGDVSVESRSTPPDKCSHARAYHSGQWERSLGDPSLGGYESVGAVGVPATGPTF